MFGWSRPVTLVNGRVMAADGEASSIRFASMVRALGGAPEPGDTVVDLHGAFVLPGLINAHDHLELNHYGALKRRSRYENATDWIDDLRPVIQEDAGIRANSAFPLRHRLFIGGLKNLLAGATTVAHHNPLYRELDQQLSVRLLRAFRWAHSFALEGHPVGAHGERGAGVRATCDDTPPELPFIVHAAEGVDRRAEDELARLEALGCLKDNTVLVHAVAMSLDRWRDVISMGSSLVWCPASNEFLFGRTIPARQFLDQTPDAHRHLCLGTDSRVTGASDLLEELRVARAAAQVTPDELLRMVTSSAASILRLPHAGALRIGEPADFIVVPPTHDSAAEALLAARRADLQCVAVQGRPLVADEHFAPAFAARRVGVGRIVVDGVARLASARVARGIARCPIREPGVSCLD